MVRGVVIGGGVIEVGMSRRVGARRLIRKISNAEIRLA